MYNIPTDPYAHGDVWDGKQQSCLLSHDILQYKELVNKPVGVS